MIKRIIGVQLKNYEIHNYIQPAAITPMMKINKKLSIDSITSQSNQIENIDSKDVEDSSNLQGQEDLKQSSELSKNLNVAETVVDEKAALKPSEQYATAGEWKSLNKPNLSQSSILEYAEKPAIIIFGFCVVAIFSRAS